MKRCPQCNRVETDDALTFCRTDGTPLVRESVSVNVDAGTAKFGSDAVSSEIETSILPHTTDASVNRATAPTTVLPAPQTPGTTRELSKSNRRKVIVVVAVVCALGLAVVIISVIVSAFLYRSRTHTTAITSIAVMPFANASGNADVEYLSDGMTETLINSLSQLPNLSVKARSSVFRYKGKEIDPKKIASELNVQAILNGRVVQRGEQLTVSLELIDALTENVIWSESYNRKQADLITLQSEIARDVSSKLKARLSGADAAKVAKNYTASPEAYHAYLKGYHYLYKFTDEDVKKSFDYFQQAIKEDTNYALAYAGLAEAYVIGTLNMNPAEVGPKATAAARKSLAIDPALAEAHYALALVSFRYNKDWLTAEREFQEAIRLKPGYAMAYDWYGYMLAMEGRFDDALEQYRLGLETDPLSTQILTDIGTCYYWSHRYDQAKQQFHKPLDLDPAFPPTLNYLAATYAVKGQYANAVRILDDFKESQGIFLGSGLRGYVYAKSGKRAEALRIINELNEQSKHGYVLPESYAFVYAGLGDKDQAIAWLQKSCDQSSLYLQSLKVEPMFDELRSDPRFTEVVRCVGVPQ